VPEIVIDDGRAALLTRALDAELAELLLDSALESAQVRGDQDRVRLLSFQAGEVSLEVQLEDFGDEVGVRGLVDGASGAVEAELRDEHRSLAVDDEGVFDARLPRGAARFRLRSHGGTVITTGWVLL
jgi:hypothetical protein